MKVSFYILGLAHIHAQATSAMVVSSEAPSFASFISKHGRSYTPGTAEYEKRRSLFEARAAEANQHNSRENRRWTAGVNYLMDWTDEELARLNGYRGDKRSSKKASAGTFGHAGSAVSLKQTGRGKTLPKRVHWHHLNASKSVRSQGSCGSCWAVAAATILQAHSEIYTGKNWRTFAVQDLVNCVPNPHSCGGTGGCEGATVELALDWAWKKGVAKEKDMPYEAYDGTCEKHGGRTHKSPFYLHQSDASKADHSVTDFGMKGWHKLPENKYEPLMWALYEKGPVAVSVGASDWHSYAEGIFDKCEKDIVVNHAVTCIGYGVDKESGDKFWNILNSWGEDWGERGHMRLLRTDDEEQYCGTDDDPAAGTACEGGPSEVTVCGMCGVLYDSALPTFAGSKKHKEPKKSFMQLRGA